MGYTTEFQGEFNIDKPLSDEIYNLINGLNQTRRMKRSGLSDKYGVEGEFYYGDGKDKQGGKIIDQNEPPSTQPSLWLNWKVLDDKQTIVWDEGEKFYHYVEWIGYLIESILKPNGYIVNGEVDWVGEDVFDDGGTIVVKNNVITIY